MKFGNAKTSDGEEREFCMSAEDDLLFEMNATVYYPYSQLPAFSTDFAQLRLPENTDLS